MSKAYRLGVAGLVHDHVWKELSHWQATGRVKIVAAADPHEPLRERLAREFGVQRFYDDAAKMFEDCELDVVQVCASNTEGAEVVEAAAARGVHAVVEKPMAANLPQADRMLAASEQAGTVLFINWPNRWRPNTLQAWKLVNDGAIGQLFDARIRMAHGGPRELGCSDYFCDWLYDASRNGAGALVDYCSYGAVGFRYLLGMPLAVQAVAGRLTKTDIPVEDNAVITLIYEQALAHAEASWSQVPAYHDAVYLGTTGTLWTESGKIWLADNNGRREITVEPLPAGAQNGPEYFLTCLETEQRPTDVCSALLCRDAQEILEAGLQSAVSGRRIALPLGGDEA
jgi:predicted dehydrogenase